MQPGTKVTKDECINLTGTTPYLVLVDLADQSSSSYFLRRRWHTGQEWIERSAETWTWLWEPNRKIGEHQLHVRLQTRDDESMDVLVEASQQGRRTGIIIGHVWRSVGGGGGEPMLFFLCSWVLVRDENAVSNGIPGRHAYESWKKGTRSTNFQIQGLYPELGIFFFLSS